MSSDQKPWLVVLYRIRIITWKPLTKKPVMNQSVPIGSMYGIFTYIWLIFRVNVGIYTIHGWYGVYNGMSCLRVLLNVTVMTCFFQVSFCPWSLWTSWHGKRKEWRVWRPPRRIVTWFLVVYLSKSRFNSKSYCWWWLQNLPRLIVDLFIWILDTRFFSSHSKS